MVELFLAYLATGMVVALAFDRWTADRFIIATVAWPMVAWRARGRVPEPRERRRIPDTWENRVSAAIGSLRSAVDAADGVPDQGEVRVTLDGAQRALVHVTGRRRELAVLLERPDHDRAYVERLMAESEPADRPIWEQRLAHIDALGHALRKAQDQLERGLSHILNLTARLHLARARRRTVEELEGHLDALGDAVAGMEEVAALEEPVALPLPLERPDLAKLEPALPVLADSPNLPTVCPAPAPIAASRGATGLDPASYKGARLAMTAGILACASASMFYRAVATAGLKETSALFIGFPAVIAVALALLPPSRSYTGLLLKVTTLGILMSGVILGEGLICALMAAPLMYLVATGSGVVLDLYTRKSKNPVARVALLLPLVPLSLEGTPVGWELDRAEEVTVARVVSRSAAEVEQGWAAGPRLDGPLPTFLSLGFPRPVGTAGVGLEIGDRRVIHFAGGEGVPGTLTLEVGDRGPDWVRFVARSDTSHIGHWLSWETAEVRWEAIDADHTRVTWTARYRRGLDPGLYFGPLIRYGVSQAGAVLMDRMEATHAD